MKSLYAKLLVVSLMPLMFTSHAFALDVGLTASKEYVEVYHKNKKVRVQRNQDQTHQLGGGFAKTSRKCPPFCIQPMEAAPGVATIGEAEIFRFMENQLRTGRGVIIDARIPSWYAKGTIPGSINIPFTVFEKDPTDAELINAFKTLGVKRKSSDGGILEKWFGSDNEFWDYGSALEIVVWCNGPWCGQSPRAIRALVKQGYPVEKMYYYRGGMQMWQILGLITVK